MRLPLVVSLLVACSSSHGTSTDAPIAPPVDAAPDAGVVPHRAFPQVTFGGGQVLSSMRLVVVTAAGDPLESQLGQFCTTLVTSQWWSTVTAEYGLGAARGCVHLVGAAMTSPSTVDDTAMTQYIANAIAASPMHPQPDGQTMYLLFLPPGVGFAGNGNCSYSGYHLPYGTLGDGWGVAMRCQFDFSSILESLTTVGSHEVIEAATDPDTTSGWALQPMGGAKPWAQSAWLPYGAGYGVEVGDFCIASHYVESGVAFQRSLSNAAAAAGDDPCVPALSFPYYNITVPQDWYAVPAGGSVDIPLTGWSTATTDPWEFTVGLAETSTPGPPLTRTVDAPLVTIAGFQYHTMTTGQTSTMHITMASTAMSGQWRTFWLYSYRLDASGADGIGGDDHDHLWRVGIYVP